MEAVELAEAGVWVGATLPPQANLLELLLACSLLLAPAAGDLQFLLHFPLLNFLWYLATNFFIFVHDVVHIVELAFL